ncbi:hypothetical protein [Petropleomorpha daqingensis]|uniref:Secreted protein n=1 Tax=Petropleomorpha daqingensis TaxID=2026353 RepID=A0A853CF55_9ACTN|nr:hypothetical protein [Petropleomorpha daqingensis]NYJ06615.1 hypothetical protein [Petropleomorpha daqingensis]
MRRRLLRSTLVLAATGAVLVGGGPAALAGGDHGHGRDVQTVHVVGNGTAASVDDDHVHAGTVRFEVSSVAPAFSAVTMFQLKNGATLDQFFDDVRKEFHPTDLSVRAEGTRDARRHATFYGLADVVPGVPLAVTENLRPGTYWLMDLTTPPDPVNDPPVTRFRVTGGGSGGDGSRHADVRVRLTDDRFLAPRVWPRAGTWWLTNADDTLHFMLLQPVQPGTTERQVQQALEASGGGSVGDLADPTRPPVGSEVISPGVRHAVDYDLPPGRYVLLCFVADEGDGMSHAVMGMHRVIDLR